jgi:hypothetical protein
MQIDDGHDRRVIQCTQLRLQRMHDGWSYAPSTVHGVLPLPCSIWIKLSVTSGTLTRLMRLRRHQRGVNTQLADRTQCEADRCADGVVTLLPSGRQRGRPHTHRSAFCMMLETDACMSSCLRLMHSVTLRPVSAASCNGSGRQVMIYMTSRSAVRSQRLDWPV